MAQRRRRDQPRQEEQLCCVGSKCSTMPANATQLYADVSWNALLKATAEAISIIKDAIRCLQDDGFALASKKPFNSSKKPLTKVLASRLGKASLQLTSLHSQIMDMKNQSAILEEEPTRQGDSAQLESSQTKDDLTSTKQKSLNDLQEDESENGIMCEPKGSKRVSFRSPKASMSHETEEQKLEAVRLKVEQQMKAENDLLKRELEEALFLNQSERSAHEQVERYKEVVARVTADNMVFLMKLKQSEHALQVAQEQQRDLARQLEIGRLKFLQEVSSEIEDTVISSLSKAEAYEKELHFLQIDNEKRTRECQQKLQEAHENLHQAKNLKERLLEMEEERSQILSRLESETKGKECARSEVHALHKDVEALNEQLSKSKADHMAEMKEIQDKVKQLELKEQEVDQLLLTLDRTSAQLETQQTINVVLMKKKEEMEWLFLEAKAEKENLQKQCRKFIQK